MNCLFCDRPMHLTTAHWSHYRCNEIDCWYKGEFSRYVVVVNDNGEIATQEYSLGSYYVKIYPSGSVIYRLVGYVLVDGVVVPRAFWLNPTNIDATLDKLKMCVTFS
jgi:hypothetical protein